MTWLAFYNKAGVGDVLLLTSGPLEPSQIEVDNRTGVTLVKDKTTQNIVSLNVFDASQYGVEGEGPVQLSESSLAAINQLLAQQGVDLVISQDATAKFVVGQVETCVPHEDSDHLHITTINIGQADCVQIVCGAKNIAAGQHVIVATPGAVMPSGAIIWPGELRGVASAGMVCSTRELGLEYLSNQPGIWVVDDQLEPGTPLETVVASYQA